MRRKSIKSDRSSKSGSLPLHNRR